MSTLKGISDTQTTVVKETASVIPFLIKTAVVCGIAGYVYYRFTNRFIKMKENPNYPAANVSDAQAKSRANSIIGALDWFGGSYDTVADALAGLNYNGFVKVYNAFGYQRGHLLSGEMNLIEWLHDQFDGQDLAQLSSLQNGAFFKNAPEVSNHEQEAIKLLITQGIGYDYIAS